MKSQKTKVVYQDKATLVGRLARLSWQVVWTLAFRPTPAPLHFWRRFLLRLFGAKIGAKAHVYASASIWAPWNLEMGPGSCLGRGVDCYSVDKVILERGATVSQRAFLCTAGHDPSSPGFELTTAPVRIGEHAWVAAEAYVAPGVEMGAGAVAGARACVTRSVPAWTVVAGNPARKIGKRRLR